MTVCPAAETKLGTDVRRGVFLVLCKISSLTPLDEFERSLERTSENGLKSDK